jgi:hypothetical protein
MGNSYYFRYNLNCIWKFSGALAGQTFDTVIHNLKIRIHFPKVQFSPLEFPNLADPEAFTNAVGDVDTSSCKKQHWGQVLRATLDLTEITEFELKSLVLEVLDEKTLAISDMHEWAKMNLDTWCEQVTRWVEILGDQVSDLHARDLNSPTHANIESWSKLDGAWSQPFRTLEIAIGVGIGSEWWGLGLDRSQFEFALQAVVRGRQPPFEHQFLCDARTSLLSGKFRKSVIEAAVAMESTLAQVSEAFLEERDLVEAGLKNLNFGELSLGSFVSLIGSKDKHWPISVTTRTINVRNAAAHRSGAISKEQAGSFFEASQLIVNLYSPKIWM